jgi:hypothetical protein
MPHSPALQIAIAHDVVPAPNLECMSRSPGRKMVRVTNAGIPVTPQLDPD